MGYWGSIPCRMQGRVVEGGVYDNPGRKNERVRVCTILRCFSASDPSSLSSKFRITQTSDIHDCLPAPHTPPPPPPPESQCITFLHLPSKISAHPPPKFTLKFPLITPPSIAPTSRLPHPAPHIRRANAPQPNAKTPPSNPPSTPESPKCPPSVSPAPSSAPPPGSPLSPSGTPPPPSTTLPPPSQPN